MATPRPRIGIALDGQPAAGQRTIPRSAVLEAVALLGLNSGEVLELTVYVDRLMYRTPAGTFLAEITDGKS